MKSLFKKSIILIAISAVILLGHSCKETQKTIKPIEIKFKKEGELQLFKSTSDSLITGFDIEIADNDYETQTGLMHRKSMAKTNAMLFIFNTVQMRSFYMKNTYIPLDIIYLNKDKIIVSIQRDAKPLDETTLPSEFPAQYVLEINAGLSQSLNIEIGDRMDFTTTH